MKNILLLVLCLLLATSSFGQVTNSTITGTVADSTGAVLPGVTVHATNAATGVASTNVTNEAGAYTIQGLISGTYTVSVNCRVFSGRRIRMWNWEMPSPYA
jgi:hypothetical protein